MMERFKVGRYKTERYKTERCKTERCKTERYKMFDRALYARQIGGNGIIVIADVIYLIAGVFFGRMSFNTLCHFVLAVNMLNTCILYHNCILSRTDDGFELNTEKIVYYPTTRLQFLLNKYVKTLILLIIQLTLTLICLGLGYLGSNQNMPWTTIAGSLIMVYISILMTSGAAILVMYLMPFGIYLSMILYFPLILLSRALSYLLIKHNYVVGNLLIFIILIILATAVLWFVMLWFSKIIYEKIN